MLDQIFGTLVEEARNPLSDPAAAQFEVAGITRRCRTDGRIVVTTGRSTASSGSP